jgi:acyl carrier protein phosphodiesterase
MNFLAHAHLSFNNPPILVGNMISDFIKGKKQFDYPAMVQKGIQLHRAIDNFTDTHEATQQINLFFKPHYRLYAGAFTDVTYDYFLANDLTVFATDESLKQFATGVYNTLENNFEILPQNFQAMLPYMKAQNWLYNYKTKTGINRSFAGLVKRSTYLIESDTAFTIFNENFEAIQLQYNIFYTSLQNFTANKLQQLLNT